MPTITVQGDVSAVGWQANPPGALYDALNEASQNNTDYVFAEFGTPDPAVFTIPPLGPGTHSVSVAASVSAGSTSFRILLQDSSGVTVGSSAWQAIDPSWTVYTADVTIPSGVASRFAIQLTTAPQGLMATEDGPISTDDGYVSFV